MTSLPFPSEQTNKNLVNFRDLKKINFFTVEFYGV